MTTAAPVPDLDAASSLLGFIDASPSPFHACATVAEQLSSAGFAEVDETGAWPAAAGARFLRRGGSLVAWATAEGQRGGQPLRIVGAHTDSPNLRVRPNPDAGGSGYRQLAVEVYGGALLNSWLDRDLGLSGRLVVRSDAGPAERLLRIDRPLLRVPQLAIHLDRAINQDGLKLNPQQHLNPIWSVGEPRRGAFMEVVAADARVAPADVLGWDLMAHDLTPGRLAGAHDELLSAPRLDNLASCWAGMEALVAASQSLEATGPVPLLVLFDHEEVGSGSDRGAMSTLVASVVERIVAGLGGGREDVARSLAGSRCLSADMAHATHPNYADRHEPGHLIALNGGPVLKVNANLRYASDAVSTAALVLACEQAGVPLQRYSNRSDLPCGTTIGPLTAAALGVSTVDVGAPMLAMHSARELAGSADPAMYAAMMTTFLRPS